MAVGCDGCGTQGVPLAKVSLGRDFFGGVYDRLTPALDTAPAWYCPACSQVKRMQVDFRLIRNAWRDQRGGAPSPLDDPAACRHALDRLCDIAARLDRTGPRADTLLGAGEVAALVKEMNGIAGC
ncbi:MAG: hypothetical protein HZA24_08840 [Nitrospirae bacterium]|nr:hypothetical protein [Nitrospirota bacterium]